MFDQQPIPESNHPGAARHPSLSKEGKFILDESLNNHPPMMIGMALTEEGR